MAATLEACTREEQHAVVRFLGSEGEKPADIHRRMKMQYGDACVSLQQVYEWHRKFKIGVSTLIDAAHSGQPHTMTTPNAIAAVERVIRENGWVTIDEVAGELKISHGSSHHMIHDVLQYHKVSTRWVPKQLIPELKERRVDVCEILLRRYEAEEDGFLHCIVTGDECWVHYFQPETKRASKEWRHSSLPKPKKFRTTRSASKLMLTLFWDYKGPILQHYMPRGLTINSKSYCDLLQNHLKPAVRSKRRGMLSSGVLLQHDNVHLHTAHATAKKITDLHLECIPHPAYSPDLAL
jgi:histone-lysine N-methyltransferase SETMAR